MVKRGSALVLVFWLIFFGVLAGAGYYVWTNYSKTPNESTKKLANTIFKYPSASKWTIEEAKNLCLSTKSCSQPVKIYFETNNNWNDIYGYYTAYFANLKWATNTTVVTSIPTSVVFKKDLCEIVMENHGDIKYSFTVVCQR